MSTDYEQIVLDLVREAVPDRVVFDGQPDELLEERPTVHVIVDINAPQIEEMTVASTFDRAEVKWQTRVVVRAGKEISREDAAWVARTTSRRIRDHLIRRRLREGGGLIQAVLQSGFVDDQAVVSHSNQIQVTQYRAEV